MTTKKIAFVGNPNVGKSSIFNKLTNLRQKVGNYPGVTVEKKTGTLKANQTGYEITDLPGVYSLYPNSIDEEITYKVLSDTSHPNHPDLAVIISDPTNLKRSVILYQQIRELGIPAIFTVNMVDEMEKTGQSIDFAKLEELLQTKVVATSVRKNTGLDEFVKALDFQPEKYEPSFGIPENYLSVYQKMESAVPDANPYQLWHYLSQKNPVYGNEASKNKIDEIRKSEKIIPRRLQVKETLDRNEQLEKELNEIAKYGQIKMTFTDKLDKILIHPVLGYLIFFGLLLLIFQAVYSWSGPFMDYIDEFFANTVSYVGSALPEGPFSGLLTDGIIAGIGGIVMFIPQIVILFLFISIMEETGYMSRVVFLMDRWLKPFGLNGKSVVPLVSGVACAIPAVMSARTIDNPKERLLTILVTPFITCSARLPIYIVIIGLVIPDIIWMGFNIQGLALFGMYLIGFLGALGSAWLLNKFIKSEYKSYLFLEMPKYKLPQIRNVLLNVWEKASGFIFGAGKIILIVSIILWVLGNVGFGDNFWEAETIVRQENPELPEEEVGNEIAAYQLENSLLGYLGRIIEPVVRPLGYDWKMGIGLITSFAAREVFVGTMATVYSLGDTDDELTIRKRMAKEINRSTGKPAYNLASGISLLLFYAFAMQCVSTIAVVKKETNSWKWTLIQLGFMSGLAYLVAFVAYQWLSGVNA